jgi:peptide-methionine (S)-S-oxide reductase
MGRWALAAAAAAVIGLGSATVINLRGTHPMKDPTISRPPVTAEELAGRTDGLARATFGTGCFWCTEAVFQQLKGVEAVVSGYSGGHVKNPTYDDICGGDTGHAEVIHITSDPEIISYAELLEVFWRTHDPTTLNRQGNDVGPQYRSAIFYHSDVQRAQAEHYKKLVDEAGAFDGPIVTEIAQFTVFYPAEDYHQNFYRDNPGQSYCSFVVRPKLEKFRKAFADKVK